MLRILLTILFIGCFGLTISQDINPQLRELIRAAILNQPKADSLYAELDSNAIDLANPDHYFALQMYKGLSYTFDKKLTESVNIFNDLIDRLEPQSCDWQMAVLAKGRALHWKLKGSFSVNEWKDIDSTNICPEARFLYGRLSSSLVPSSDNDSLRKVISRWPQYFEESPELEALYLINFGSFYYNKNDFDSSIYCYEQAIQKMRETGYGLKTQALVIVYMMNVYNAASDFDSAARIYNQFIEIDSTVSIQDSFLVLSAMQYAAIAYYYTDDYKNSALELFHAIDLLFELYDSKAEIATAEAEAKYDFYREEAEKLKAQAKADELQLSRQRIVLAAGGLIIALLSFLLYANRKSARRKQKLLEKESEIDSLVQSQELLALEARLQGGRKERDRLGRDLHDRVGAMLSTAKLALSSLQGKGVGETANRQLENTQKLVDDTIAEVRRVSHNILASAEGLLFEELIESFVKRIEQSSNIEVHTVFELNGYEVNGEASEAIYRVVMELFSNTLKYAEASEVNLNVVKRDDGLSVIFEDDGKGFDQEKKSKGIGIQNVMKRIRDLGGEVHFDSSPGLGTTVVIDIPLR